MDMFKLIRSALVVTVVLLAVAVAPMAASAAVAPEYKGWGYTRHHCSGSMACTADFQMRTAYQWTGVEWVKTSRGEGTRVYLWPYGSGWHWTWTAEAGWLAMLDADLTYRR